MHPLLGKISALSAALLLALPPGFCCFAVAGTAAKGSPPKSCCQKSAARHSDQQPAQHCPHGATCCERHGVNPPDAVQISDLQSQGIVAAVPALPLPAVGLNADPGVVLPHTGPPLHVLHCVWLI